MLKIFSTSAYYPTKAGTSPDSHCHHGRKQSRIPHRQPVGYRDWRLLGQYKRMVSTPERRCIGGPEQKCITDAAKLARCQTQLSGSINEPAFPFFNRGPFGKAFLLIKVSLFGLERHFLRPGLSSHMRRVEQRSGLAEGHRRKRRVAVLTAASTARRSIRRGSPHCPRRVMVLSAVC